MIKAINFYKPGASSVFGACINWLVSEMHRIVTGYKEQLPSKSRKFRYPQFLWVPALYHDGFDNNLYREKFNKGLYSVMDLYREMNILKLHTWNPKDSATVTNGSLNGVGHNRYWTAVNDAFQAWDKEQMKNAQMARHLPAYVQNSDIRRVQRNDRFHWSSNDRREDRQERFSLPKPPQRR